MPKIPKNRAKADTVVDRERKYSVEEACALVKKAKFAKFGDVLDRVKRQLRAASNSIEATGVRTRAMERKLRSVEELSEEDASRVLALVSHASPAEGWSPLGKTTFIDAVRAA